MVALALLLHTSACMPPLAREDRSFDGGDLGGSLAGYEAFLATHARAPERPRILFQLAMLYGTPEAPQHDPGRAEQLLLTLIEEYPGSPWASWVARSRHLERRIPELEAELGAAELRISELTAEIARAEAEAEGLRGTLRESDARLGETRRQLEDLRISFGQAVSQVESRQQQLERLREALELLKKIDLKSAP